MDGSNPTSGIPNAKVQKQRERVTEAEEMKGRRNLGSRRLSRLFLREEDNERVGGSRMPFQQ